MQKLSAKQKRLQTFLATDRDVTGVHNDWSRRTPFARYNPETGEIYATGTMSLAAIRHEEETLGVHLILEKADPTMHFVKNGCKRFKSSCPAVLDGVTLRNCPVPSRLTIIEQGSRTQEEFDITDPTVEIGVPPAGDYVLILRSAPHTDGIYRIIVNDHAPENQA